MRLRMIWILCLSALALSCSDRKPTEPRPFEFRVRLRDSTGAPLAGAQVFAWNTLPDSIASAKAAMGPGAARAAGSPEELINKLYGNVPNPFNGYASFRYSLAAACPVNLRILDALGNPVRTLVSGSAPLGMHQVIWDGSRDDGVPPPGSSRVFDVRLTVWSADSTTVVFRDTTYAALYVPDQRPIGYTDAQGEIVSTDRALFPSACDVPPLTALDPNGDDLGTFSFSDSLVIAVVDTASHERRQYERVLSESGGSFDLTW